MHISKTTSVTDKDMLYVTLVMLKRVRYCLEQGTLIANPDNPSDQEELYQHARHAREACFRPDRDLQYIEGIEDDIHVLGDLVLSLSKTNTQVKHILGITELEILGTFKGL